MNEKKPTREERHTAKRLTEINELLSEHVSKAPRPKRPPILHIVAAFGLDTSRPECGSERAHLGPWASLGAKEGVADLAGHDYWNPRSKKEEELTREDMLWQHVRPLLRRRLFYRVSGDLLPAWKREEMKCIAKLTGFDYAAEWEKICRETLPPPKSWGAGIDPLTLEGDLAAQWRELRKSVIPSKAKKPGKPKPPVRAKRRLYGVTEYLYPCRVIDEAGRLGSIQECWFENDEEALRKLPEMVARGGRKLESIALGGIDDVTIVTIKPALKKAA